jgi:hypothetical protein
MTTPHVVVEPTAASGQRQNSCGDPTPADVAAGDSSPFVRVISRYWYAGAPYAVAPPRWPWLDSEGHL